MSNRFFPSPSDSRRLPARRPADNLFLSPAADAPQVAAGGDFDAVQSFIRRRWLTILGAGLVTLVAVAIATFLMPSTYESSSTFLIEMEEGRANTPALAVLERVGQSESIETETQLMQSRRVLEPVVEELDLNARIETPDGVQRPDEVFPRFEVARSAEPGDYLISARAGGGAVIRDQESEEILAEIPSGSEIQFAGLSFELPAIEEDREFIIHVNSFPGAVGGAGSRISAAPIDNESNLIRLTCEGHSPDAAHDLCASVSKSYIALRSELQRTEASTTADFLIGQVAEIRASLTAAEDSLRTYRTRNAVIAPDVRAAAETQNLAMFKAQREQLEAERAALANMIESVESRGGGTSRYRDLATFPTFIQSQNQTVTSLLASLVDLENRRAELSVSRTARNPDIVAIDQRIESIELRLNAIARNYEEALGNQIASLNSAVGQTAGQMQEIPAQQIETARLERQVSLLDNLYTQLQTRLREAQVAEAVTLPSVRIVDEASMPISAAWPNVPLMLGLGFFLGLGLGLVVAAYQEHADKSLHAREEVEQETGVSVLSMIPRLARPGPVLPVTIPAGHSGNGRGGGALVLPADRGYEQEIALESFRSIVADLRFAADRLGDGSLRSVAITSTSRGEGKTFTACNLALTRANQGARTLLVDTDFRAKGVARFFGLKSRPGVAEVLSGTVEPEEAWHKVRVDENSDLWVLPSGSMDADSSRLLHTDAFERMLSRLTPQFELVIVDTPPLNVLADAAQVASSVDGVMVVVRGGMTDRKALEMVLERLERANGQIMGILLNDVKLPEYYTSYSHETPDVD